MKNVLLILTGLVLSHLCCAQAEPVFALDSLQKDGLVLNHNWLFYPEDNRAYANIAYKDGKGIPLNPALLLAQLPPVERSGIGWFRLVLDVDSSLQNKTVGMMISLFGAAEVYLNGQRVYQFGTVSKDHRREKTQAIYGTALSLTLGSEKRQLLAVRFSHQPQNMYLKTGVVPFCLRIVLRPLNENISDFAVLVKRTYQFIAIALTIELASALLTLFFFFSFPERKEYLFFGLYFSLNFLGVLVQSNLGGVGDAVYVTVSQLGFVQLLIYLFLITGTLFHLNGMYALLQKKRTRYYWFLLCYAGVSLLTLPFMPKWGSSMPDLFFVLACFELLPNYFKAARNRFRGAWILFSSIVLSFLFLLVLVVINHSSDSGYVTVLTALTMLTPALGIMIFLAGDFARTSLALKARVAEVETLSQKTLAQERDKQDILAAQKEELERQVQTRTAQLRKSLTDLKATQAQLIHSEKMASLGELTAGIAHEIQNPLNFVNNFSESNTELLGELKQGAQRGNFDEVLALAKDIEHNHQKITYHGKRADSIVKSMLQHSRVGTGTKESTDINKLVDEYLRLSYQGMKAKDKSFNAALQTDFDQAAGMIHVVPQDIGRALLNVFNNAFYAVQQKKQLLNGVFEAVVSVSTKRENTTLQIVVQDNGTGMAPSVAKKVFQPFFTTKPAGEGTGLGLSLSYDIVTKGHGGTLSLKSTEGEGSEFVIQLPAP